MLHVIESRMFKAVPNGYIFQPPPPTNFSATQAYLVNESQKAEILAVTRAGGAMWGRTVTLVALALAVASGVAMNVIGNAPLIPNIVIAICIWLTAQIVGTILALYLKLHQLKPVLAGLPRSDERLFRVLKPHPLSRPRSARMAAFWCAGSGIMLGYASVQHRPFTAAIWFIVLALNLYRTIKATSKSRQRSDAG
jgi:hypothetical protein